MRILIVRHGDPDYVNDTVTARGEIEAQLLAQRLCKEKVDYLYVSPLGRAKATAKPYVEASGKKAETIELLREFGHTVSLPYKEKQGVPWDLLPTYYSQQEMLLDRKAWFENEPMAKSGVYEKYKKVCADFDALLLKHGYERDGLIYKAVRPNTDTLVFICHFGIEAALLSHLFNCAPHVLWQNMIALPTSVTTLYTEERREGIVTFRCCGFGDVSHLLANGVKPSPAGRFCETYDLDERKVDPDYQVSVEER